uniref:Uncharacterized protein n=1 Tax=Arundo donax TaxID=35708 RepID=A0A0A9IJF9_ARUDO
MHDPGSNFYIVLNEITEIPGKEWLGETHPQVSRKDPIVSLNPTPAINYLLRIRIEKTPSLTSVVYPTC